jgi:heavy metal sensor kinase
MLLAGTFIFLGTATTFGLQHYLRANLRDSLTRRSTQVEQIVAATSGNAGSRAIAEEIENRVAPEFNNRFVRVTRLPADVIYRSGSPADRSFDPSAVGMRSAPRVMGTAASVTDVDTALRLMIRSATVVTDSGSYLVEVGVSIQSIDEVVARLLELLALLLPMLLLCAAAGGYWLVKRALLPVDRLSQTAEQLSLQNPTLRLPVARTGDALERLSMSLNSMLGRLLESVKTSRRFLADASHELRTPLTVIKGELQELTRDAPVHESDLRERVGSVLEEVARLEHLVSGLLVLSRLDAGERRGEWVDVDLAELAVSTAEQMRLIAEDRGVDIDLSALGFSSVQGDRAQLKQIIVNLLDNAIRFTPRGGVVRIRTATAEGGSVLEVSDTGIGIPPEAIPFVFDRFYRVDAARSRDDGGAGLGLSIVKSISAVHRAEVHVDSEVNVGSTFRVEFPRWPMLRAELPSAGRTELPSSSADINATNGVPMHCRGAVPTGA